MNRLWQGLLISFLFSIVLLSQAAAIPSQNAALRSIFNQTPLSAEQAFQLNSDIDHNQVRLSWQIAPHYYLYQSELKLQLQHANGAQLGIIQFPPAIEHQDPYLGTQAIYYGSLSLTVPIIGTTPAGASLLVTYRGCSGTLCYTPQTSVIVLPTKMGTPQNESQQVQQLLQLRSPWLTLLILFAAGVLLSLTPCVLPMIPILSSIIIGQRVSAGKSFGLSCSYVLGMALTYALMGMVVANIGLSVQVFLQQPWILSLGAMVMVLLALSLLGVYRLQLPHTAQQFLLRCYPDHRRHSHFTVFLMGVFATLVVSPCTSAPLIGVLGYVAQSGNLWFGGIALFFLALGMSVPLLLIGAGVGKWLPKTGPWMVHIQRFLGIAMIAMALWLVSRFLAAATVWLLFGILLIGYASFWGTFQRKAWKKLRWPQWLGAMVTLYGLLLIMNALTGSSHPWKPWQFLQKSHLTAETTHFTQIHTITELETQLSQAAQQQQPVLIDFYANWCVECQILKNTVFPSVAVQLALQPYRLLQVDVTTTTSTTQILLDHFHIVGIPTLILMNRQGTEVQRLFGNINAAQLQQGLTQSH